MKKFKVGDWVITPNRGIFQIKHKIELSSWEITLGGKAKLWQPKEDDLCIFWNEEKGIKVISRFYAFEHDGFTEAIEFKNYKFCAPFSPSSHLTMFE